MTRTRLTSDESNVSYLNIKEVVSMQNSLNEMGTAAALDRRRAFCRPKSFSERTISALTAGGLRQSVITLVQTSLGGGVLTLAFAMSLSGLGLGSILIVMLGFLAFSGMEIMMRGAVRLGSFDTATLLARCVGSWSGPAMDVMLVLYGTGAQIAYFILLGDFLPSIFADLVNLGWVQQPKLDAQELRTHCILATLFIIVPLCLPRKLSALRYATPVALISVLCTASLVVCKAPGLIVAHAGLPQYGEARWFVFDWGFFRSFNILLFAFNCHLNVVPVASELVDSSDVRITKICSRVAIVETLFYLIIAVGGYLSFLAVTDQNILSSYGTSGPVTVCRALLSFTILVGIPTNMVPSVRSAMGIIDCIAGTHSASPFASPLLLDGPAPPSSSASLNAEPTAGSEVYRLVLTFISLVVQVNVAIHVPNVADVLAFLGGSVGTILMIVLPLFVLFKAPPENYSTFRFWATVVLLTLGMLIAFTSVALQLSGK